MSTSQHPLHRLYRTKLALLATISTMTGLGLLFLAAWASGETGWSWLARLPAVDVGGALFTTGLIAILFEYLDREDAEERATERLRRTLAETAPDIKKAVIDGFAFAPDDLAAVASPATLDKIVRNSLAIQLGDRPLAEDIYNDLREQVIRTAERRYDMDISVALAPWEAGPATGRGAMFVATIRWEYRVRPSQPALRFACVSDLKEHRELLQDPTCTVVHYFERLTGVDISSEDAFELVQVSVDGRERTARRTTRVGSQIYTVDLGSQALNRHQEITLAYTYRVLVQQHSHLLHLDVAKPTKGLKVRLAYGGCGIRYVNVLDYIASARQPRIMRGGGATEPSPSIEIGFDGWVLPKAGVAFVWVLEQEMAGVDRGRGARPRSTAS